MAEDEDVLFEGSALHVHLSGLNLTDGEDVQPRRAEQLQELQRFWKEDTCIRNGLLHTATRWLFSALDTVTLRRQQEQQLLRRLAVLMCSKALLTPDDKLHLYHFSSVFYNVLERPEELPEAVTSSLQQPMEGTDALQQHHQQQYKRPEETGYFRKIRWYHWVAYSISAVSSVAVAVVVREVQRSRVVGAVVRHSLKRKWSTIVSAGGLMVGLPLAALLAVQVIRWRHEARCNSCYETVSKGLLQLTSLHHTIIPRALSAVTEATLIAASDGTSCDQSTWSSAVRFSKSRARYLDQCMALWLLLGKALHDADAMVPVASLQMLLLGVTHLEDNCKLVKKTRNDLEIGVSAFARDLLLNAEKVYEGNSSSSFGSIPRSATTPASTTNLSNGCVVAHLADACGPLQQRLPRLEHQMSMVGRQISLMRQCWLCPVYEKEVGRKPSTSEEQRTVTSLAIHLRTCLHLLEEATLQLKDLSPGEVRGNGEDRCHVKGDVQITGDASIEEKERLEVKFDTFFLRMKKLKIEVESCRYDLDALEAAVGSHRQRRLHPSHSNSPGLLQPPPVAVDAAGKVTDAVCGAGLPRTIVTYIAEDEVFEGSTEESSSMGEADSCPALDDEFSRKLRAHNMRVMVELQPILQLKRSLFDEREKQAKLRMEKGELTEEHLGLQKQETALVETPTTHIQEPCELGESSQQQVENKNVDICHDNMLDHICIIECSNISDCAKAVNDKQRDIENSFVNDYKMNPCQAGTTNSPSVRSKNKTDQSVPHTRLESTYSNSDNSIPSSSFTQRSKAKRTEQRPSLYYVQEGDSEDCFSNVFEVMNYPDDERVVLVPLFSVSQLPPLEKPSPELSEQYSLDVMQIEKPSSALHKCSSLTDANTVAHDDCEEESLRRYYQVMEILERQEADMLEYCDDDQLSDLGEELSLNESSGSESLNDEGFSRKKKQKTVSLSVNVDPDERLETLSSNDGSNSENYTRKKDDLVPSYLQRLLSEQPALIYRYIGGIQYKDIEAKKREFLRSYSSDTDPRIKELFVKDNWFVALSNKADQEKKKTNATIVSRSTRSIAILTSKDETNGVSETQETTVLYDQFHEILPLSDESIVHDQTKDVKTFPKKLNQDEISVDFSDDIDAAPVVNMHKPEELRAPPTSETSILVNGVPDAEIILNEFVPSCCDILHVNKSGLNDGTQLASSDKFPTFSELTVDSTSSESVISCSPSRDGNANVSTEFVSEPNHNKCDDEPSQWTIIHKPDSLRGRLQQMYETDIREKSGEVNDHEDDRSSMSGGRGGEQGLCFRSLLAQEAVQLSNSFGKVEELQFGGVGEAEETFAAVGDVTSDGAEQEHVCEQEALRQTTL